MKTIDMEYFEDVAIETLGKVADLDMDDLFHEGRIFVQEDTQALGIVKAYSETGEEVYNAVSLYFSKDPCRKARYDQLADEGELAFIGPLTKGRLIKFLENLDFYVVDANFFETPFESLLIRK